MVIKGVFDYFNLWEQFESVVLKKNHRQAGDKTYAELLERIRFKDQHEKLPAEDLKLLQSRQIPIEDPKMTLKVFGANEDCNKENSTKLKSLTTKLYKIGAIHSKKKGYEIKNDGTIGKSGFLDTLLIKVGARVMLIRNLDTSDGLTNGAQGIVFGIQEKDTHVTKIMVRFDNDNIGINYRQKKMMKKNNGATPIERMSCPYNAGSKYNSNTNLGNFHQFPLRLSWSLTSHKCQGMSIIQPNCMYSELNGCWLPGQAYVILGRITNISQLYLAKFEEKVIYCNKRAKEEALKLEERALNLTPDIWTSKSSGPDMVKISSF